MTKMTYGEQLKHPNWQRLRLERLSAANWRCQACGGDQITLHVHHKRYIKGRMAWEYPADNFTVLCDPCHSEAHEAMDSMQALLALLDHTRFDEAAALLAGYFSRLIDPVDEDSFGSKHLRAANVGHAAHSLSASDLSLLELAEADSCFATSDNLGRFRALLGVFRAELTLQVENDAADRRDSNRPADA